MALVQEKGERELFEEAVEFYAQEHKIEFKKLEETFPGEEPRVTFERKIGKIKKAVQHSIILL